LNLVFSKGKEVQQFSLRQKMWSMGPWPEILQISIHLWGSSSLAICNYIFSATRSSSFQPLKPWGLQQFLPGNNINNNEMSLFPSPRDPTKLHKEPKIFFPRAWEFSVSGFWEPPWHEKGDNLGPWVPSCWQQLGILLSWEVLSFILLQWGESNQFEYNLISTR
jgi:hypothetical protein